MIALILLLLSSPNAHACKCAETKIEENFAASDVVATVKARSASELEAIQVWKGGKKRKELTVKPSGTDCDYTFTEGEKYLVFVHHNATSLCSGTKPLAEANKDILWLKLRGLKK